MRRTQKSARQRPGLTLIEFLVCAAILALMVAILMPAIRRIPPGVVLRSPCKNNLKQIGLALNSYRDEYGVFPPLYTADSQGRPLHSWRTLLLPFLEQRALYDQIDLSKPWDNPVNRMASETVVPEYHCPAEESDERVTNYLALVSAANPMQPGDAVSLSNEPADDWKLVVVIEVTADRAVPWMKPSDVSLDYISSIRSDVSYSHEGAFHALAADGRVHTIFSNLSPENRELLMRGERVQRIDTQEEAAVTDDSLDSASAE